VSERGSQLVLGIDPDPAALWPGVDGGDGDGRSPRQAAGEAVLAHCRALIDATAEACVAVKLQLARFEVLGDVGWSVLEQVAAHARLRGLLVIADAKRGDIDVSADAYASALITGVDSPYGRLDGLAADLVTINPLMGSDAVEPFVRAARGVGAGVLVLVRTSNPGAADFEDLELAGTGERLWERVAAMVERLGRPGLGQTGLSDVGAVVGATEPGHLGRARELMRAAPFLLPGIGAQGGRVEDLAAAFAPGPAGGLVSASRSIVGAYRVRGGDPASAARGEAQRLREAAWELSRRVLHAG
jgi:orotidine-5'-phosphate decarboxylase